MSALILDGRKTRATLIPELITKVRSLSYIPKLAIIQVGKRADSTAFIRAKKNLAKELGINEQHIEVDDSATQADVILKIVELNSDAQIHGIIVQLPLPPHMNVDEVIESIDPQKDVDGLTSRTSIMPATARGIKEFLHFNNVALTGKKVAVVGRSKMVGKPIADMCTAEGATVTVAHRETSSQELTQLTQQADIIIVATGSPLLIGKEHVRPNQVIIDVGITRSADSGLVGDVDFSSVKDIVAAISPVPGGVGPMTVLALFENLVDLCK